MRRSRKLAAAVGALSITAVSLGGFVGVGTAAAAEPTSTSDTAAVGTWTNDVGTWTGTVGTWTTMPAVGTWVLQAPSPQVGTWQTMDNGSTPNVGTWQSQ